MLFEWHSLDHVAPDESYELGRHDGGNVDYFHLNSIDVDADGHLLVSARNTSAVYKVDRETGQVIWRLGGKQSDFALEPGVGFAYQHDVRRHSDGTITVFDNAAAAPDRVGHRLPTAADRARRGGEDRVARAGTTRPETRTTWAMGNVPAGVGRRAFVGWGPTAVQRVRPDGALRFDARFVDGQRRLPRVPLPWSAKPTGKPAMAVRQNGDGTMTVYASWNGATGITHWQIRTGQAPEPHDGGADTSPPRVRDGDDDAGDERLPLRRRPSTRPGRRSS